MRRAAIKQKRGRILFYFYFSFIAVVRTPKINCFILLLFYFYFSFILVLLQLCGPLKWRVVKSQVFRWFKPQFNLSLNHCTIFSLLKYTDLKFKFPKFPNLCPGPIVRMATALLSRPSPLHTYRYHQSELAGRVASSFCCYLATRSQQNWVEGRSVCPADSRVSVDRQSSLIWPELDHPRTVLVHFSLFELCWTLLFRRHSERNTGTNRRRFDWDSVWWLYQSHPLSATWLRPRHVSTDICNNEQLMNN